MKYSFDPIYWKSSDRVVHESYSYSCRRLNSGYSTPQRRSWAEVGVMSYLSCLLWLLSCWQLHAMIIRKESTRAVHLVIALAFDGMTCSSSSFLCPRSWILSCSLFFSQSHVGPVGLLRWSLSVSPSSSANVMLLRCLDRQERISAVCTYTWTQSWQDNWPP